MAETDEEKIADDLKTLQIERESHISTHPLVGNDLLDECEEAVTTDSEEYLSEPLSRYQTFLNSTTSSEMSTSTLTPHIEENENFIPTDFHFNNIQIPIVGYEVMEERARFTVYKLRIENKASGDCWYVFRRYTDFVRLCNRLKHSYPHLVQHLPRKRWLRNNFDPVFLEERLTGLQTFVNSLLEEPNLINAQQLQDFFCLNEPPVYSETNEESRAMFEALEDTIYQLKQQVKEKESLIDSIQDQLHSTTIENENLKRMMSLSTTRCLNCQTDDANAKVTN